MLDHGAFGIVVKMKDDSSRTLYAMKLQKIGEEYVREKKVLSQLNSTKIVGLRRGNE